MSLYLRLAIGAGLLAASVAAGRSQAPAAAPQAPAIARLYPSLTTTPDGAVLASWMERGEGGTALRFARWRDGTWGPTGTVAAGEGWLVNWADFPSVVELPGGGMAASWLVLRPGRGAYDVRLSWSGDRGSSWSKAVVPHGDGTATEHGFVSLFPLGSGAGAVWLDGRAYAEAPGGPMALRWTTFGEDGSAEGEARVDERVCDCCQTDAAATGTGAVVVYRDRSPEEVRDIRLTRLEGGTWSDPVLVHDDGWRIEACPVNGPAVAAEGGRVAVAWFTAAGGDARVNLAFSEDGGRTFARPVRIDDGAPMGRVDVLLLPAGHALVSWMEATEDGAEVRLRRVAPDGRAGAARSAGPIDPGRASGFPRMARSEGTVLLAWTVPGEPAGIRYATVAVGAR